MLLCNAALLCDGRGSIRQLKRAQSAADADERSSSCGSKREFPAQFQLFREISSCSSQIGLGAHGEKKTRGNVRPAKLPSDARTHAPLVFVIQRHRQAPIHTAALTEIRGINMAFSQQTLAHFSPSPNPSRSRPTSSPSAPDRRGRPPLLRPSPSHPDCQTAPAAAAAAQSAPPPPPRPDSSS